MSDFGSFLDSVQKNSRFLNCAILNSAQSYFRVEVEECTSKFTTYIQHGLNPTMLLAQRRSIIRYARTNRIFQLFLLSAVLGTFLLWLRFIYYEDPISTFPEVYRPYYQLQRSMPQHNSSLPYPEGSDGRYLYFDQIHGECHSHHYSRHHSHRT